MKPNQAKVFSIPISVGAIVVGLVFAAGLTFASAADSAPIHPGDRVALHFRCSLANGEVAAATDPAAVESSGLRKSRVYLVRQENSPLVVEARAGSFPEPLESAFEDEVIGRISHLLVGKRPAEKYRVKLTAPSNPGRDETNYTLAVARVRKRPKQMRMGIEEFKTRAGGKEPVPGMAFTVDPAFPGRVESVGEGEVTVVFSAKAGDRIDTAFGPGRIVEKESAFEVEIDARVGSLVRIGPLVGRIDKVDGETIKSDFRHPFGGEELDCELTVIEILPR